MFLYKIFTLQEYMWLMVIPTLTLHSLKIAMFDMTRTERVHF